MSDIDDVKSKIDIVDYIGKRVVLKKSGRNYKGLCPFHGEKTPSFMVSPDRQAFHCFGCGRGGSVIDFVMEETHADFREALEDLAETVGVTLTRNKGDSPKEKRKDTLLEIHHLAAEYYHYLLQTHKVGEKARAYLMNRGISEKIISTFHLGYSANSWDGVTTYLKKKGLDSELLEMSGLMIQSSRGGYDRFRGRLMFPIKDHRGNIIAFSGRLLEKEVKEAKYINSPETPLYIKGNTLFALDITKGAIQKEQAVIVMEGEFDVLSSFQGGISNVVAIKGTALTESQVYLLKRYAKKIIFALDSDVAGDAAARRGIEIAEKAGMELYVAHMPEGKDPDDIGREQPHVLKKIIEEAESIYDYYVSSAQKKHDLTTAYGKKGFTDELLPLLSKIDNPIIQGHYLKKVADLVSLPEQTVISAMQKVKRNLQKGLPAISASEVSTLPQENKQELLLLALLLQGQREIVLSVIQEELGEYEFQSKAIIQIIRQLENIWKASPEISTSEALQMLPSEYMLIVDQSLLLDLHDVVEVHEVFIKTLRQTVRELQKRYVKHQMNKLTTELATQDVNEHEDLQLRLAKLTKTLRLLEK